MSLVWYSTVEQRLVRNVGNCGKHGCKYDTIQK